MTVLLIDHPVTHLAAHHGFDSYTSYEVGPDDMQYLEDQQQEVEKPPGRVWPDYGPTLKHSGIQDPEQRGTKKRSTCKVTYLFNSLTVTCGHT